MYLCIFNKGGVVLFSFVFVLVIMNVKFYHGQILCTKGPLRGQWVPCNDAWYPSVPLNGPLIHSNYPWENFTFMITSPKTKLKRTTKPLFKNVQKCTNTQIQSHCFLYSYYKLTLNEGTWLPKCVLEGKIKMLKNTPQMAPFGSSMTC